MKRVQLYQTHDMTGGINYRDDAYEVQPNESPDMLNVRLMPRGGFRRRKTMGVLNTSDFTAGTARNIWSFYGNGVSQIVVQDGNDAKYSTGTATFTAINPDALTIGATSRMRAAAMNRVGTASSDRLYIQRNAEQVAWKWDGTSAVVLADAHGAYNDNLAAPAGGKMPLARYITTHGGFMFHAYTVETGVTKPNRVRWSFPGEPEDYRTNDYVDVGADDGDIITGIVSVLSFLFIFKNRAVWYLAGTDPNNFVLHKLSDVVGAVSQEAITKDEWRAYFFDSSRGMHSVTPQHRFLPRIEWMWDRIAPKLTDHSIPPLYASTVVCGWVDKRLWVAVPWGSSTVPKRVFVWDELVGRGGAAYGYNQPQGAWYVYEYGLAASPNEIGPFLEWKPPNVQPIFLCLGNNGKNVFTLEAGDNAADATAGATSSSFPSYFRSAWFNGGLPGIKKRWRRHDYVMDASTSYQFAVQHFVNYEELIPKMTSTMMVTADAGGGTLWGAANWNSFTWGAAPVHDQQIVRCMGSAGSAYAVQLRIDGPVDTLWGLNAFDLRFIPRKIR